MRSMTSGGDVCWTSSRSSLQKPVIVFENALVCDWAEWGWVHDQLSGEFDLLLRNRTLGAREVYGGVRYADQGTGWLGGRPFVAVGHSIGAVLAEELAATLHDQCRALVLVDGSSLSQFRETSPAFSTILWLRQETVVQAARALRPGWKPSADWLTGISELPEWAQRRMLSSLARPGFWIEGYWDLTYAIRAQRPGQTTARYEGPTWALIAEGSAESENVAGGQLDVRRDGRAVIVEGADHNSIVMSRHHVETVVAAIRAAAGAAISGGVGRWSA